MNVLITGATGFVGNALVAKLYAEGFSLAALVRRHTERWPEAIEQIICEDISQLTRLVDANFGVNSSLREALLRTDVLVHAAARVHVMKEHATNAADEFRAINTLPTLALAKQAAAAGVKHFIFLSTIKVNGESTDNRQPFTAEDLCYPEDPYAVSKWEAEKGLISISQKTGMKVTIIRPPLVYGPGVKGNFLALAQWVKKGIPLPFGMVRNKRSLIALSNLVNFIGICVRHSEPGHQVFVISDARAVSTADLIKKIAAAQGRKARLLPIPLSLMHTVALLLGKRDAASRVLGSLEIDNTKALEYAGVWQTSSMDEQLIQMFERF